MTERTWLQSVHSVNDGIYRIKLNRPEQMNALTPTLYGEIKRGVLMAGGMPEVDVVLISGSVGKAFAVGGDLKHFLDLVGLPADERRVKFGESYSEPLPFRTILECPKPVIAEIDGMCLAGGLVIASVCDITIATTRSVFGVPEAKVGLADPFCAALLPRAIGLPRARQMMMAGLTIDGPTAESWGLIAKVVEPDRLEKEVMAMVATLRRCSPDAMREYKRAMNSELPYMSIDLVYSIAMGSNGKEGLTAFKEKRPPSWKQMEG